MKSDRPSAETLRNVPIFKRMNDSEIIQLAEIASVYQAPAGETVVHEGKKSQRLWIVLEGECEVFKEADGQSGEPIVLAVLEPYSNFGEMSFFHPAPHSASVRAKTPLTLLKIDRVDYDELVEDGASAAAKLACNALESLSERLRRMDEWVADLLRHVPEPGQIDGLRTPEWSAFRNKLFTGWNL